MLKFTCRIISPVGCTYKYKYKYLYTCTYEQVYMHLLFTNIIYFITIEISNIDICRYIVGVTLYDDLVHNILYIIYIIYICSSYMEYITIWSTQDPFILLFLNVIEKSFKLCIIPL